MYDSIVADAEPHPVIYPGICIMSSYIFFMISSRSFFMVYLPPYPQPIYESDKADFRFMRDECKKRYKRSSKLLHEFALFFHGLFTPISPADLLNAPHILRPYLLLFHILSNPHRQAILLSWFPEMRSGALCPVIHPLQSSSVGNVRGGRLD